MVKIKTAAWEPAERTAPIVAELFPPVHGRNTENSRKVQTFLYGYDLSEGFLAFYGIFLSSYGVCAAPYIPIVCICDKIHLLFTRKRPRSLRSYSERGRCAFHRKERILQEKISVYPGGLHLMLCDPLAHLLGDGLDRAILKRNLQPGGLHQLRIAGQTGTAHQLEVAFPGIPVSLRLSRKNCSAAMVDRQ